MRRKKRSFLLLVLGLLSLGALGYLIISFPPSSQITDYNLPTTPLFFILLFLLCASLLGYLTNNTRRGIIIGVGICIYLLLRLFGLKNILFPVLIVAIFITIELFFSQKE